MSKRSKVLIVGSSVVAFAAGGAGIAAATGADDERPITGTALEQAKAAALEHTGEGTVTETETDDEESFYEVEVTLEDGSETDVQLNRDFSVVGDESDVGETDDGAGDD